MRWSAATPCPTRKGSDIFGRYLAQSRGTVWGMGPPRDQTDDRVSNRRPRRDRPRETPNRETRRIRSSVGDFRQVLMSQVSMSFVEAVLCCTKDPVARIFIARLWNGVAEGISLQRTPGRNHKVEATQRVPRGGCSCKCKDIPNEFGYIRRYSVVCWLTQKQPIKLRPRRAMLACWDSISERANTAIRVADNAQGGAQPR